MATPCLIMFQKRLFSQVPTGSMESQHRALCRTPCTTGQALKKKPWD